MTRPPVKPGFASRPGDPESWIRAAEPPPRQGRWHRQYGPPDHRRAARAARAHQGRGFPARNHRRRHAARAARPRISSHRGRRVMISKASRHAHGRPLPDGPAPFTTLVELTFKKQKIEHWIRFGRKSYEQILDRRRSIVGFAPNSVFAFVRWAAGEHGTVVSRLDIVRAIGRGEPFQTLPFVRPAARSCCGWAAG